MILLGTRCHSRGWLYRDVDTQIPTCLGSNCCIWSIMSKRTYKHGILCSAMWFLKMILIFLSKIWPFIFYWTLSPLPGWAVIQALSGKGKRRCDFARSLCILILKTLCACWGWGEVEEAKSIPKTDISPPPHQLYVLLIIVYLSYVTSLKCSLFWKS